MGHSFLEFRDKLLELHDAEIEWLFDWLNAASRESGCGDSVRELIEWCKREIPQMGNGCLDIPLDAYLASDEAVADISRLLDAVRTRLDSYGDAVPMSELNRIAGVQLYHGDVRTPIFQRALLLFRSLIEGDLADLA